MQAVDIEFQSRSRAPVESEKIVCGLTLPVTNGRNFFTVIEADP